MGEIGRKGFERWNEAAHGETLKHRLSLAGCLVLDETPAWRAARGYDLPDLLSEGSGGLLFICFVIYCPGGVFFALSSFLMLQA